MRWAPDASRGWTGVRQKSEITEPSLVASTGLAARGGQALAWPRELVNQDGKAEQSLRDRQLADLAQSLKRRRA